MQKKEKKMSKLLVFGVGIICGMVLQTILIFMYGVFKINSIDKK